MALPHWVSLAATCPSYDALVPIGEVPVREPCAVVHEHSVWIEVPEEVSVLVLGVPEHQHRHHLAKVIDRLLIKLLQVLIVSSVPGVKLQERGASSACKLIKLDLFSAATLKIDLIVEKLLHWVSLQLFSDEFVQLCKILDLEPLAWLFWDCFAVFRVGLFYHFWN